MLAHDIKFIAYYERIVIYHVVDVEMKWENVSICISNSMLSKLYSATAWLFFSVSTVISGVAPMRIGSPTVPMPMFT